MFRQNSVTTRNFLVPAVAAAGLLLAACGNPLLSPDRPSDEPTDKPQIIGVYYGSGPALARSTEQVCIQMREADEDSTAGDNQCVPRKSVTKLLKQYDSNEEDYKLDRSAVLSICAPDGNNFKILDTHTTLGKNQTPTDVAVDVRKPEYKDLTVEGTACRVVLTASRTFESANSSTPMSLPGTFMYFAELPS